MILPSKKITATIQARRSDTKDLIKGIRNNKSHQINTEHSTPLINNLETKFFKDKEIKEKASVTNLINRIVQILKQDLKQLRISTRDTELIKQVELWDEG